MSGFLVLNIRGDTHMTSALREGGGGGGGVGVGLLKRVTDI